MCNTAFVYTPFFSPLLKMLLCFPSTIFIWLVCVWVAPSLSLCVCVFVFTERPKECVWWGDIGCIGAPRAQEETQMCAAMRGFYLFSKHTHTHITHTYIHTHAHTPQPPAPFPCSAKAGWQHCPPQGRLERKQPTKFQIIVCNNKKLHS